MQTVVVNSGLCWGETWRVAASILSSSLSFPLPVCSCPCQAASGSPGRQAQMELELLLRARNSYANIWLLGLYILPPPFLFLPLTSIPSLKLAISRTQTGAPGDFSLPRGTASGGRENSPPVPGGCSPGPQPEITQALGHLPHPPGAGGLYGVGPPAGAIPFVWGGCSTLISPSPPLLPQPLVLKKMILLNWG